MTTNWLSRPEQAAWVRLIALLELLPAALDTQLRQDAGLTNFEYYVLAMLSEAEEHTLRMTTLAAQTNASLSRLSHVVRRLEDRDLVERFACAEDRRATNARLTKQGWDKIVDTAPGHVAHVRALVIDALTTEQVQQLTDIADVLLPKLDPTGAMGAVYRRHDGDEPLAATGDGAVGS